MRIKIILRFFIVAVLVSCQSKKNQAVIIPDKNFHPLQKRPNSIIGNWLASGWIYTIELNVYKDSTFKYFYSSDVGRSQSEGRWRKNGNFFVLTSFDKFKSQEDLNQLYTYFDHVPFQFRGDTLCEVDQDDSVVEIFAPNWNK